MDFIYFTVMASMDEQYNVLLKAFLPDELFNYFVIVDVQADAKIINIYLDELNLSPDEHKNLKLISKGFYPSVTIQDFPIRKKAYSLTPFTKNDFHTQQRLRRCFYQNN